MIETGEIEIAAPAAGSRVFVGDPFAVSGSTTPGENTRNGASLPATSVRVSVDGGPPQSASMTAPQWSGWATSVQAASPGSHIIRATARRLGYAGNPVWQATATVTVDAQAPRLAVVGAEATQAIQFCNINGQGSGFAPDNSVPLVAQKSTVVRVYVERVTASPPPTAVSAVLLLDSGAELPPVNGPIPAAPRTAINRNAVNSTLNFILPASQCVGTRSCTIQVFDPDAAGPRRIEHQRTFSFTFRQVPRIKVHLVGVHITGPGGLNLAAPSDVAMEESLGDVSRFTPLSGIDYSGYTVIDFADALTGAPTSPGACTTGWGALVGRLRTLRDASGTTDVYVGMMSGATPVSQSGCGGTRLAAARNADIATLAHELGHALGRSHTPCGAMGEGGLDPAYPTYDAFPAGSIGEVGFSVRFGTALNPATTFDIMSYCSPQWISPYTWTGMMNGITAGGSSGSGAGTGIDTAESVAQGREQLYLNFRVYRDDRVEMQPSFHLNASTSAPEPHSEAPVGCDLIAPDGTVLATKRCRLEWNQSVDDPYIDYHVSLPWDAATAAIGIWRDGETIHVHPLEDAPPNVEIGTPEVDDDDPRLARVTWAVEAPSRHTVEILRYTCDDGATWKVVAVAPAEPHLVVDLDALPGGERCRFQIVASAGVRTAVAESGPFSVPLKPVRARILEPADGTAIAEGEALNLRGIATSPNFGTTPFDDMLWSADPDGPLDIGYETVLTGLPPGRHRFTLTVPNGLDGESVAEVSVTVRPRAD